MGGFTVLCVEDNEVNLLILQRMVEKNNLNVLKATSAEAGIDLARQHHPNLILMDVGLPGIDGLTATRMIKQDPELSSIPVIAVTADTTIDPHVFLEAGCEDHVLRPISMAKLMGLLNRYKP